MNDPSQERESPEVLREFLEEDLEIALKVLKVKSSSVKAMQRMFELVVKIGSRWLLDLKVPAGAITMLSTQAVLGEAGLGDSASIPRPLPTRPAPGRG